MSDKSSLAGKRKRAAMRRDQPNAVSSSIKAAAGQSAPGQKCFGHRRGWHFGKDPCYRANRKSVVSIRTEAHSEANGVKSEKACCGLDI